MIQRRRFPKKPAAVKDYEFIWTEWMPEGDEIDSSTFTVSPAGLIIELTTNTPLTATVWVSEGEDDVTYTVTNEITTVNGRVESDYIEIVVKA